MLWEYATLVLLRTEVVNILPLFGEIPEDAADGFLCFPLRI